MRTLLFALLVGLVGCSEERCDREHKGQIRWENKILSVCDGEKWVQPTSGGDKPTIETDPTINSGIMSDPNTFSLELQDPIPTTLIVDLGPNHIKMHNDGRVEFSDHYTPGEVALEFWKAIERQWPSFKRDVCEKEDKP